MARLSAPRIVIVALMVIGLTALAGCTASWSGSVTVRIDPSPLLQLQPGPVPVALLPTGG